MALTDPFGALDDAAIAAAANERVPMNETSPDLPTLPDRYAFREIDYGLDASNELQFSFTNHLTAQALPPSGIDQVIDDLLAQVIPAPGALMNLTGTGLSGLFNPDTPLDLEVTGRPIYIVLRLTRNMTFSPELKAMTHKKGADKPNYGALTHVSAAERNVKPIANCRIIYFIAKPVMPARTPYEHEFNFNILLAQSPRPGSPEPRALKIELDPDVRFPGGSGVGEGP